MTEDLYAVLGVPPDADPREIHRAYRRASKSAHPDHGGDPARWALVATAKEVLGDPERRALYDRTGTTEKAQDAGHAAPVACLAMTLMAILQDCANRGLKPSEWDLAESLRDALRNQIRATEGLQAFFKSRTSTMAALAERFDEPMRSIAKESALMAMRAVDDQIKVLEQALKMVREATFKADARVDPYMTPIQRLLNQVSSGIGPF